MIHKHPSPCCALLVLVVASACNPTAAAQNADAGPSNGGQTDGGAPAPDGSVPGMDGGPQAIDGGTQGPDAGNIAVPGDIGTCQPVSGACPSGAPQVDILTTADLESAARGEGAFSTDAPGTCYLVHNGTYASASNVLLWVTAGGLPGAPRRFVGASRDGVVITGRGTIEASHVVIENMTFNLTGYSHSGSFNTITVGAAAGIALSHLTLTGDCATGLRGGHVEVDGADGVVLECSTVERFGQCNGDGHLDHGVYLASGSNIAVRNNIIRENSSRGIQLNTEDGAFGTLGGVTIERNRIYDNGHRSYEDGIVINGNASGTISQVTIERNLIYGNQYAGVRFVGNAQSEILVQLNTFYGNGVRASGGSPSEINLDDVGSGAGTVVTRNLVASERPLLNNCYDATGRGFLINDNLVSATPGNPGACVTNTTTASITFEDAASGNFHTGTPQAAQYGAYAP